MNEDDVDTPQGRRFLMKMLAFLIRIVEQRGQVNTEDLWILMNSVSATCHHVDLFAAMMNAHAMVVDETRQRDHFMYMRGWNDAWAVPSLPMEHHAPEIQPETTLSNIDPPVEMSPVEVQAPIEVQAVEMQAPIEVQAVEIEMDSPIERSPVEMQSVEISPPTPDIPDPPADDIVSSSSSDEPVPTPKRAKKKKVKKAPVVPPKTYPVKDMTMDQIKQALVTEKDDNAILELESEVALRTKPSKREFIGMNEGCDDFLHRVILFFTIGKHHYSFAIPLVMESTIEDGIPPKSFSKISATCTNEALQILIMGLEDITFCPASSLLLQKIITKLLRVDCVIHILTILASIYSAGIWGYMMAARANAAHILMIKRTRSIPMDKNKIKIVLPQCTKTMCVMEAAVLASSLTLCGGYYHAIDVLRQITSKTNIDEELSRDIIYLDQALHRFRISMHMVSLIAPKFPALVTEWVNAVGPTASLAWDMDGLSIFITSFWDHERARMLSVIPSQETVDQKMSPIEMIGDNAAMALMGQIPIGNMTLHDFVCKEEFLLLASKMGTFALQDKDEPKDVIIKLCLAMSSQPSPHLEEETFVRFMVAIKDKCHRPMSRVFAEDDTLHVHQARILNKLLSFRVYLQTDIA